MHRELAIQTSREQKKNNCGKETTQEKQMRALVLLHALHDQIDQGWKREQSPPPSSLH